MANVNAPPEALPVTTCILFVKQFIVTVCEPDAGAYVAQTVSLPCIVAFHVIVQPALARAASAVVHCPVVAAPTIAAVIHQTVPVNVGEATLALRFNAVCCAVDTGFAASEVLSTFHNERLERAVA